MIIARLGLIIPALAGLVLALATYLAAHGADKALALGLDALDAPTPAQVTIKLIRARAAIDNNPAAPVRWHVGAMEAMSWIDALDATKAGRTAPDPALLAASRNAAEAAVRAAPVQPMAWMRLAALTNAGAPSRLCDARTCLTRSWQSAPMLARVQACERIRIAIAAGYPITPESEEMTRFLAAAPPWRMASACLSGLPAKDFFTVLVRLREETRARESASQAR